MKTFKSISVSAALAILLITSSANAGGGLSGGATEWTQIANNAELGSQYSQQLKDYAMQSQQYQQQIQQYINQYQSYAQMLQNIGKLPQAQWNEFQQSVMGLKKALDFQQALSFTASSYDTDFKNYYPGYDKWLADSKNGSLDFQATYKQLGDTTRDTVNGSLQALNVRAEDMQTDEQTMRTLSNLSQSAAGQKAAIQAANDIALHQTHQLKKMEQTMMIQANMQGEYYAMQNEKKAFQEAQAKAKASDGIKPTVGDEKQVTPW
ncbi:MAG: P-type conjugative transfer protein TrbJ [Sulfurovum sp.]|nr:P-type conjugative transfer protein TrbJ [Sulfurovum sp.]MDD3602486.1 P-type conjugative transfer protein TrbJ [Sulfurovum sp.]